MKRELPHPEDALQDKADKHRKNSRFGAAASACGLSGGLGLIALSVGAAFEKAAQENPVHINVLTVAGGLGSLGLGIYNGIRAIHEGQNAAALEGVLAAHELQQKTEQ